MSKKGSADVLAPALGTDVHGQTVVMAKNVIEIAKAVLREKVNAFRMGATNVFWTS
jgi:hypothetical protein